MKPAAELNLAPLALLVGLLPLLGRVAGMPTPEVTSSTNVGNSTDAHIFSGCSQNQCPDFDAEFDGLVKNSHKLGFREYSVRWNQCGECREVTTSKDMCTNFHSCGRPQNICIDTYRRRAHWIRRTDGRRWCYSLTVSEHDCDWNEPAWQIYVPREIPCAWSAEVI